MLISIYIFRRHCKSPVGDGQKQYVLIVDVPIMMPKCICTRARSQCYVVMHDKTDTDWFMTVSCAVWQQSDGICAVNYIGKNFLNWYTIARPSIESDITNLLMNVLSIYVGETRRDIVSPFKKSLASLNHTFTNITDACSMKNPWPYQYWRRSLSSIDTVLYHKRAKW